MTIKQLTFVDLIKDPRLFLAFGFGSGVSPKAPGTMGTLVALPFVFLLQSCPLYIYALVLLVGFFVGI